MKIKHLLILGACLAALGQAAPARAEVTPEQFVALAESYQRGYLDLMSATALQVYSTAGLVAMDFNAGKRSGVDAADALEDTALLHSVAYASLLEVQKATPKDDGASRGEIGRLAAVLVAEQQLLTALNDVFSNPTQKNAQRVQSAQEGVGKVLDKLAE
jgi:hypothetical protein